MKTNSRWVALGALAAGLFLAGCATDSELSQKEKDRIEREQQREAQKQAKSQEKMMRETTGQRNPR
jgi:hypothetical protein